MEWVAGALSVPLPAQDWETAYPSMTLGLEHQEAGGPQDAGLWLGTVFQFEPTVLHWVEFAGCVSHWLKISRIISLENGSPKPTL